MKTSTSLKLGHTYHTTTGIKVTPIKVLPNEKAVFVTDEFYATPFIVWSYKLLTNPDVISLYSGNYYPTLDQAIRQKTIKLGPMRLLVSFYCPDCEELYYHEFSCHVSVQELVEQIEDARVHCTDCGYTFMGIHSVMIADDRTQYDLPLWHGPVISDGE